MKFLEDHDNLIVVVIGVVLCVWFIADAVSPDRRSPISRSKMDEYISQCNGKADCIETVTAKFKTN